MAKPAQQPLATNPWHLNHPLMDDKLISRYFYPHLIAQMCDKQYQTQIMLPAIEF